MECLYNREFCDMGDAHPNASTKDRMGLKSVMGDKGTSELFRDFTLLVSANETHCE